MFGNNLVSASTLRQRGYYKLNGYNNTSCSHCMDEALINRFDAAYFPNGYKK